MSNGWLRGAGLQHFMVGISRQRTRHSKWETGIKKSWHPLEVAGLWLALPLVPPKNSSEICVSVDKVEIISVPALWKPKPGPSISLRTEFSLELGQCPGFNSQFVDLQKFFVWCCYLSTNVTGNLQSCQIFVAWYLTLSSGFNSMIWKSNTTWIRMQLEIYISS